MAQLMPLPLTVSCFSKIQIGFTFLVPAHPGSPGKGPLNGYEYCTVNNIHLHKILNQAHQGKYLSLKLAYGRPVLTVKKVTITQPTNEAS